MLTTEPLCVLSLDAGWSYNSSHPELWITKVKTVEIPASTILQTVTKPAPATARTVLMSVKALPVFDCAVTAVICLKGVAGETW